MNFLRAGYFASLAKHGWMIDAEMASAVGAVGSGNDLVALPRVPKSNGWDILACIVVSSIYAAGAVVLSTRFDCSPLRVAWVALFAAAVCVVHVRLYVRSANGSFLEALIADPRETPAEVLAPPAEALAPSEARVNS